MNRTAGLSSPLFGLVLVSALSSNSHALLAAEASGEAVSIFNGKNLNGWVIENGGKFSVRDGLLFVDQGTGWLRSKKQYGDIVLKMEFRFLEQKANSGIFIRTKSTSSDDENGWPDNGYQVQCMDIIDGARPLATMIPYGAPPFESTSDLKKLAEVYRPTGKWNTYEITTVGQELTVKLNGAVITRATNIKHRRGHVGIQAEHGLLEFRNLTIQEVKGEQ